LNDKELMDYGAVSTFGDEEAPSTIGAKKKAGVFAWN
jgi:hypothetical protein